jgi:hypothetical protein
VIPAEFTGGWVRASIALGGAPAFEDTDVWWLQSYSKHADLRVPRTPGGDVVCFAGSTVWTAPFLTWVPDLELVTSGFPDTGVVSWDGADLLEAGITDSGVGYVERWRRLPDTAGPLLALRKPSGRLVRTGSLALTVMDGRPAGGAFNAVAWRLAGDVWTVDHCRPADASAPPPPVSADLTAGTSVVLDDGARWTVDEASNLAVTGG